jgi:hypothetical protein
MEKVIGFFALSILLFSCSENSHNSRLEIRLTDAPGDYQEVNIDIQGIEINSEENSSEGWKSIETKKGIYNLLALSNGLDTLLSSVELPSGKVSQIRLILGNNNTVKIDGVTIPLTTPSAQQSGLKLNLHATLTEGITYKVLLDFDAARSIVHTEGGKFNLKPVIRSVAEAQSGAIKGLISPAESMPAVFAIVASDTIATAYADSTGNFLLRGISPGTYTISINPKEGFNGSEKTGVIVTLGNVTDLGTITLQ